MDKAGNLYGLAADYGPDNGGTIWELSPSNGGWTYSVLYSFSTDIVCADAARHTATKAATKREPICLHFRTRAKAQMPAKRVAWRSLCASQCRPRRCLELVESPSRRQRASHSQSHVAPEGGIRAALPDERRGVRHT